MERHHIQSEKQGVCLNKSLTSLFIKMLNDHLILLIYLPQISFYEGILKTGSTETRPHTLDQVKENIRREVRNITDETFPKVMTNMAMHMQAVQ